MVQWLRLPSAEGSIPGWGTRIPHALRFGKKKKKDSLKNYIRHPGCVPNHSYYC